jgi:hypothetical protein
MTFASVFPYCAARRVAWGSYVIHSVVFGAATGKLYPKRHVSPLDLHIVNVKK